MGFVGFELLPAFTVDISRSLALSLLLDPPEAEDAKMDGEGGEHPRGGHPRPDWVAVLLET